jgi:DNA transposition AAA+ family ATPase
MIDRVPMSTTEFLITKEYRRFAEFCDACHRYRYIGLCYGLPGVGKTLSARYYAHWDLLETVLLPYPTNGAIPPQVTTCHTLVYTPSVTSSPDRIGREVRKLRFALGWAAEDRRQVPMDHGPVPADRYHPFPAPDVTELLIIDEADRLKMTGVEHLRDIYDHSSLGLIFIGMPGLEKRLARYPQLYSRVGFVHHFRPLSPEEMQFILQHKWQQLGLTLAPDDFTDAEAVAAIARITNGNFRLIQRLFAQIERILQINNLRTITQEVVETAREGLVIGPS